MKKPKRPWYIWVIGLSLLAIGIFMMLSKANIL